LLPKCRQEDTSTASTVAQSTTGSTSPQQTTCISIGRPGGVEQLRVIRIKPDLMTCGYNVPGQDLPFTKAIRTNADVPPDCIVLRNEAFSVNYADCCIQYVPLTSFHSGRLKSHTPSPLILPFGFSPVADGVSTRVPTSLSAIPLSRALMWRGLSNAWDPM
jgi:hypothetical protein